MTRQTGDVRAIFRKKTNYEWNRIRSNLARRSQKEKTDKQHADIEAPQVAAGGFESGSIASRKVAAKRASSMESLNTLTDQESSLRLDGAGEVKGWDVFRVVPLMDSHITREGNNVCVDHCLQVLKLSTCFVTFLIVLTCAVIAKGSLIFMTSQIRREKTTKICSTQLGTIASTPQMENINWTWSIFFVYSLPQIFTMIICFRQMLFKSLKSPSFKLFFTVLFAETLHTVGLGCLIFKVLPELDSVKGAMLTNCLCFIPGILSLLSRGKGERKRVIKIILDIIAIGFQATGCIIWPLYLRTSNCWAIPVALVLTSIGWWENYIGKDSPWSFMQKLCKLKEKLKRCRYKTYIFMSIWKIIVMFLMMVAFSSEHIELLSLFSFNSLYRVEHYVSILSNSTTSLNDALLTTSGYESLIAMSIQVAAALVCFHIGKFTCKICIQRFSFAFPINLTMPVVISLLIFICGLGFMERCSLAQYIPEYLYWECYNVDIKKLILNEFGWVWLLWLLSQFWITFNVWKPNNERLAKTERLFILPLYEGFVIDQSLAMNRRRGDELDVSQDAIVNRRESRIPDDGIYESIPEKLDISSFSVHDNSQKVVDSIPKIYACTTMWHENSSEMMQMLKSLMRMDEDQSARRNAIQFIRANDPDYYEFEAHIFFDDSYEVCDDNIEENVVNSFVLQFVESVDVAASDVHQCPVYLRPPKKIPTPYGGRLVWTLPGRNKLVIHLKDKSKIRHRKRWSQVMYMYYLLGHQLMDQPFELQRKDTIAENTYILMLDGDIDFRPNAVQLLVDLMKKNPKVGAACGRIHPIGSGPMVWYQKFEYAIGHWLQKATEHMIGCVLCSPGCFSLFRAKALMDDNVMKKYTTKSEKARHYIQFDQGEDRWLCTLLLQRGYRVEYCAASDAYTHAPEGFNEFFNQRRRWVPSTMANIMDLLSNYKQTIRANDNISLGYIAYQVAMMLGTILGSGTIFLMIVGAMVVAFKIDNWTAFLCNIIPIVIFVAICLLAKAKLQLILAQILSTLYALMMMAVIVGTILQVKEDGVISPSTIFMIALIGVFFISALLHPLEFFCIIHGILYFICIPSMYLLMTIYSLCNLHVVTWGTRETVEKKSREQLAVERKTKTELQNTKFSKTLLNILKGTKGDNQEERGNLKFDCGNLCRFTFCLQPQVEDIKSEMLLHGMDEVLMRLDYIDKKFATNQEVFLEPSPKEQFKSPRLRKYMYEDHMPLYHPSYYSDKDSFSDNQVERDDLINPYWLEDPALRFAEVDYLSHNEVTFWRDLISKYLYPLDGNIEHLGRVAIELKELRNKVTFGFFMLNSLFILIIFLLQLRKEELFIPWPIGLEYNITNVTSAGTYGLMQLTYTKLLRLEPIGVVFIFFFMLILIIQFIAMLFHRLGTFAHILASTDLACSRTKININDDDFIERNAVEIARALQALRGFDDTISEGSDETSNQGNRVVQRKRTIIKNLENSKMKRVKTRTLDVAFKKRFMALQNEEVSQENLAPINTRDKFIQSIRHSIRKRNNKKPRVETFNIQTDSSNRNRLHKSRPTLDGVFKGMAKDKEHILKNNSEEVSHPNCLKNPVNSMQGIHNEAYKDDISEDDTHSIATIISNSTWLENEMPMKNEMQDNVSNATEIENF